ncbi:MAG TPA: CotH kinase family protein [Chitinophagaceae bacterium]|nr:CotH kinase family protein [Chitinophagaceae bacterium]
MMNRLPFFILSFFLLNSTQILYAQCSGTPINHWESCVLETMSWKYKVPTAAIAGWNTLSFNDASWTSGIGGIGYGDGDDNTVLPNPTVSVYMRRTFTIVDTAALVQAVFCMDYDDGFVAYLNGKELARSNVATGAAYNALATADHEAQMYQGFAPDYFNIPPASLDTFLVTGTNVLCIELHNYNASSADLSARAFLQLGISNSSMNYSPVPTWFVSTAGLISKLPIVSINTLGQTIVDDPRITCNMGIIYNGVGALNCYSDPFNEYNGKITIENRGSTSQWFPKKPFGFSTVDNLGNNLDVDLLGYPEEHDWILLNPYTDKTFMRDALSYDLARNLNWYASRARFVELVINDVNQGVYVLLEKIKRDPGRVAVAKITPTANTGDSLTGGYVFKVDKVTGSSGPVWNTPQGIPIQNHDPDWNEITTTQNNYLHNFITSFENALYSTSFTDPNNGYRKYANVFSFADLFILNELSNNLDGYRLSTFMHKDRDSRCGRLTMGPIWDYNLSFGNGDYCNGYPTSGWQLYQGCGLDGTGYWMNKMLQDPWFKNIVHCRWTELRQNVLSTTTLMNKIDSTANYLREAANRDSAIWQTIGTYVWPNGWIANSWQGEVDSMKLWLTNRLLWMDANMYSTTQPCNSNALVSVVIDEMNYHSDSTRDAGDWIELWNYGTSAVNLSNAMLIDGDTYEKYCVLPNNTILNAGARLVIYEDSLKFVTQFPSVSNKLGPLCFKLNDAGQKLVLRDKDNKIIFSVTFSDNWQKSTDGHGRTLQLVSSASIPNNAASWFASCVGGSPGVAYSACNENPICTEINYYSAATQDAGDWFELYNSGSTAINLSGWQIRDGSNTNVFNCPNYNVAPSQYVVFYSEAGKFTTQFPTVTNKIGPLNFSFSNSDDVIRIYNQSGKLQYSVAYNSISPWPLTPHGGGYTLENGQYTGNANNASNWFAGCPEGSPGFAYNPACYPVGVSNVKDEWFIKIVPNPVHDVLRIYSSMDIDEIVLTDLSGRIVFSTKEAVHEIDMQNYSSGTYLLRCKSQGRYWNCKVIRQ